MKQKFTPVFVLLFFIGQYCFSQNVVSNKNSSSITSQVLPEDKAILSGVITDKETGKPLPGATIYLPDIKQGAISDATGFYKLPPVNSGKYLIEISYQGYATITDVIEITGNTTHNFLLSTSVREQEAVTVTGVSFATRLKQSSQPVSIVKREDLINTTSTNVIDALAKTIPGVSVLTTGPAISKPFIRGLGYNRVVTVNDGVRQEGQQWGDEHGIEIDDYSAQRVEVLKGPSSLMYGSDAIAGVINIQSQLPAPEGTIKADFQSEYQSNNRLRGFYGNIGGTKNGFSWNAYGDYKGAQDYSNKYDGRVFNSKFFNKNVGGMVAYSGSWGSSKLLVTNFNQHLGIIEGDRDPATGQFVKVLPDGEEAIATETDFEKITPEVPFQVIRHFKVTSDNSISLGKNRLDFLFGFQQNRRQEFGNPDNIAVPDAYFDLKTENFSVRFQMPSGNKWRTTIGTTGMAQSNTNKAAEVIIPDYSLFDAGIFIFTQYTKDKLTISGGARVDNRHVNGKAMTIDGEPKFTAFGKNFANVSGSIGLSYEASKELTLKANFARGFRAPNFAELSSNGAHEGTNRYEVGNNNLSSEVSYQADAGLNVETEHISLDASIFYNHINNFIFYERMSNTSGQDSIISDPETGTQLEVYKFAQQSAYLYGAELHLDIHPHPLDWLHFENTFSYTRGKFTSAIDGSNNIPFVPAARLVTEFKGNFLKKGKSLRNVYASISGDYTFNQDHPFTGYNTETPTGSYYILNAGIGSDIVTAKGNKICSVHFTANNITDVAYQSHVSRLKYTDVNEVTGRMGVFEMGRNFGIKLDVPLSFKM